MLHVVWYLFSVDEPLGTHPVVLYEQFAEAECAHVTATVVGLSTRTGRHKYVGWIYCGVPHYMLRFLRIY